MQSMHACMSNQVRVFDNPLANLVFGYSHSRMWANTRASSKHKLRSRQRSITTPRKQRARCPIVIPRKKRKLQKIEIECELEDGEVLETDSAPVTCSTVRATRATPVRLDPRAILTRVDPAATGKTSAGTEKRLKAAEYLNWAQCDKCDKWRILGGAVLTLSLSREDMFTCSMVQRTCAEPEDEEDCARGARVVSHDVRFLLHQVPSQPAHRSTQCNALHKLQSVVPEPSPD